jgi:transposase
MSKTPKAPKGVRKIGPEARAQAMAMLVEGLAVSHVARALHIDRGTVADWRDSPEGQKLLAAARAERAAAFAETVEDARRILREGAPRAAQKLVDTLESGVPFEAATAAQQILNRVGVPSVTKVETAPEPEEDLSGLTDAELDQYEALSRKARAGKPPAPAPAPPPSRDEGP